MSEYFDKVDENDRVVGKVSRDFAHIHGIRHRAVHVFIQDKAGKWVLQKRSADKDIEPLLWTSSCSGHVDCGESYANAAVRECHEELGILITPKDLIEILRLSPCKETGMEFVRVYYQTKRFETFRHEPKEILELKSYKLSEIMDVSLHSKPMLSKSFIHIFNLAYRKLSRL